MSKRKKTPEFKTEAEERTFWETHDSSDYVDWSQAKLLAVEVRRHSALCSNRHRKGSTNTFLVKL